MSKNTFQRVVQIVFKSEIVLREAAGNTGSKTRRPVGPGEICHNYETPGSIDRVGTAVKRRQSFEQFFLLMIMGR